MKVNQTSLITTTWVGYRDANNISYYLISVEARSGAGRCCVAWMPDGVIQNCCLWYRKHPTLDVLVFQRKVVQTCLKLHAPEYFQQVFVLAQMCNQTKWIINCHLSTQTQMQSRQDKNRRDTNVAVDSIAIALKNGLALIKNLMFFHLSFG